MSRTHWITFLFPPLGQCGSAQMYEFNGYKVDITCVCMFYLQSRLHVKLWDSARLHVKLWDSARLMLNYGTVPDSMLNYGTVPDGFHLILRLISGKMILFVFEKWHILVLSFWIPSA